MNTLPYGSWPSPVGAADLSTAALRLSPGLVEDGVRYWTEGHPEQGGRVGLWRQRPDQPPHELTDAHTNVRTAVNEYGGGDWTVSGDLVAYCSSPDGAVWLKAGDAPARILAPGDGYRYAALVFALGQGLLLAVREDHRTPGDPQQTIVALALDSANDDGGRVLVAGADFYAHPGLSADGRLAWCQWNHPHMPWDQSAIVVAPLAAPHEQTTVSPAATGSALYPAWAPDGALIYLSDADGFWNFRRWSDGLDSALWPAPHDFCPPLWALSAVPYTVIDSARLGCSWLVDGFAHLGVLDFTSTPHLEEIRTGAVSAQVDGRGRSCLAVLGFADRPTELVELDWHARTTQTLRRAGDQPPGDLVISRAEPLTWDSPDGPVHAWFYPPTSSTAVAPAGEHAPVQVWTHGGPTAFAGPEFSLAVQFWTSRGVGILDVNYSGSSGYGRAYRDRLAGNWGLTDVRDCVAGAAHLVRAGRADPARLSIRGGSAGGYTTLAALTTTDTFAAGISLYGIGDLESLATDSHKFEAHYLDGLVGPYPAQLATYRLRSPIHHLDRLSCPMLILQGADDPVVPPSQATAMAHAVGAKGLAVRLRIFPGESHGFRRADTIEEVARLALDFLAEVHGFTPAAD
jgi:Dipeptidyl aminopeptidases/acylaminoacyl-peptidases